jgi:hypothetical protein
MAAFRSGGILRVRRVFARKAGLDPPYKTTLSIALHTFTTVVNWFRRNAWFNPGSMTHS